MSRKLSYREGCFLSRSRTMSASQEFVRLPASPITRVNPHVRPQVAYITSESVPLWFTLGKNTDDLVPTGKLRFNRGLIVLHPNALSVYTLWKHPDLLSILSIPGKSVPAMLHGPFLLVPDVGQYLIHAPVCSPVIHRAVPNQRSLSNPRPPFQPVNSSA